MQFGAYGGSGRNVPCKGCDKRKADCHAHCAAYSAFKNEIDKEKASYKEAQMGDMEYRNMKRDNIWSFQKKLRGRKGDKHGKQWTHGW